MVPQPKKQLRWGRVFIAILLMAGIAAGVIFLLTKK